jgi:hypothetical protein
LWHQLFYNFCMRSVHRFGMVHPQHYTANIKACSVYVNRKSSLFGTYFCHFLWFGSNHILELSVLIIGFRNCIASLA